jgi:hypothetical protein
MSVDPAVIYGEEGAISMDAMPVGADPTSWVVEVASHSPVSYQMDETGPDVVMTQVTAPAGPVAGLYRDTVNFTSVGDHVIICFNGTTRVRERVFAGEYPAWDPDLVAMNTVAYRYARERRKAAAIGQTTGLLNG